MVFNPLSTVSYARSATPSVFPAASFGSRATANATPTRKHFEARPYQDIALSFLKKTRRANLYADMGMGKTSIILALIEALNLHDVLIVAPLRVAREVWPAECQKWTQFQDLDIEFIGGDHEKRVSAMLMPPRISAINYEQLQWLVNELGEGWPYTTVICDESTRLKGFRGYYKTDQDMIGLNPDAAMKASSGSTKRALALAATAHSKVERWINLTGTPSPNGLLDLWGPQWFIDGGRSLGRTYSACKDRWFYRSATQKGIFTKVLPLPGTQREIEQRIKSSTLAIRTKDWFDIAEPLETTVPVVLPPEARAPYKSMARNFFAEVQGGTVTAANCAVKSQKLLQFASGAVYHAPNKWSPVHDAKIAALESIVAETNAANLLVVYQFVHEAERIEKAFKAVSIDHRDAIADWNAGKIRMLLAHPKSAGHGLNLQDGGHHIVFFSPTWDLELHAQVLERIGPVRQFQSGYDRPVYVYHILARDTLDEAVYKRRVEKASVMDALMDAMKTPD